MLKWEVADAPLPPPNNPPPRGRAGARWLPLLLAALLVGVGVRWWSAGRVATLREGLLQSALQEERARQGGLVVQAPLFLDPAAPGQWQQSYLASYRPASAPAPLPTVEVVRWEGERAMLQLDYGSGRQQWESQRAFRLVEGRWRRTPLSPLVSQGLTLFEQSEHFVLLVPPGEAAWLRAHPSLLPDLAALHRELLAHWPVSCADCTLTLQFHSQEFTPVAHLIRQGAGENDTLMVALPLYVTPRWDPPLSPAAHYRLALATEVVQWLTSPSGLHADFEAGPGSERVTLDALLLLRMLQAAEARQQVLSEAERRALRNQWRSELDGQWPEPFSGPLPLDPEDTTPDKRRRWLILSLLLERQIALGGPETPGELARSVLAYPAIPFRWERFFAARIGGSLSDVKRLGYDYVLTQEAEP